MTGFSIVVLISVATSQYASNASFSLRPTACPVRCTRDVNVQSTLVWGSKSVVATVTAETLVTVVNQRTNSTRTTTITNTEVNLSDYTPIPINSAGTRTTTILLTSNNAVSTRTVTFPTHYYKDYPSSYTVCGTLPTSINGAMTCIDHPCIGYPDDGAPFGQGAPTFQYPSHPPIPDLLQTMQIPFVFSASDTALPAIQTPLGKSSPNPSQLAADPKGLSFEPEWTKDGIDVAAKLRLMMPALGVWNCDSESKVFQLPDVLKTTALYLTATSMSTEDGDSVISGVLQTHSSLPQAGTTRAMFNPISTLASSLQTPIAPTATIPRRPSSSLGPSRTDRANSSPAPTGDLGAPDNNEMIPTDSQHSSSASPPTLSPSVAMSLIGELGSPAVSPPLNEESQHSGSGVPTITFNGHPPTSTASNHIANGQAQPALPATDVGSDSAATPTRPRFSNGEMLPEGSNPTIAQVDSVQTPVPIMGAQRFTTNSKDQHVAEGQTLAPNIPITTGFTSATIPILLENSNGNTIPVAAPSSAIAALTGAPAALSFNDHVFTANSNNQYIIDSQTLIPNSPITLGSGTATTPILLQNSNGKTILAVGSSSATIAADIAPPSLTIGNQVVTANAQSQYIIGSDTLNPGGTIMLSGTPVSLAPSATQIVVGGSTARLENVMTSGTDISIVSGSSEVVLGTSTERIGVSTSPQISPSLPSGSSEADAGTSTGGTKVTTTPQLSSTLVSGSTGPVTSTSTDGLGALITSGFAPGPSANALNGVASQASLGRGNRMMGVAAALMTWMMSLMV